MRQPWFRRWGLTFYPTTLSGASIAIVAILFAIHILFITISNAHSVSDVFYGAFPFLVPTFLLYDWLAIRLSRPRV